MRRGIDRLIDSPAGDFEAAVLLWLSAEQAGMLSHVTALALHDLSDALPGKAHHTVPPSWRRRRLRVPAGPVPYFADDRELSPVLESESQANRLREDDLAFGREPGRGE